MIISLRGVLEGMVERVGHLVLPISTISALMEEAAVGVGVTVRAGFLLHLGSLVFRVA